MSALDLLRPDLRDFALYTAGDGDATRVRLHANELPYRPDIDDSVRGLNRYPLGRDPRLTERLASLYNVAPDQVLATRGSDDAIDLLVRAFCTAGRSRIVCTAPGFAMYPQVARLQGCAANLINLAEGDDFALDPGRVLDVCSDAVTLVFLCSPHNPTGRPLPASDVATLAAALRDRAIVVVDEAYGEFASTPSATELLPRFDNLVVLRTLSKAYGLAAARVGAAVGPRELIATLDALLMPFPLPAASVDVALAQTEPPSLARLKAQWASILAERERLRAALAGQSTVQRVWPSEANFLLLRCAQAASLVRTCHAHGLLVRLVRGPEREYVRVTIGTPQQNDLFLGAMNECAA